MKRKPWSAVFCAVVVGSLFAVEKAWNVCQTISTLRHANPNCKAGDWNEPNHWLARLIPRI